MNNFDMSSERKSINKQQKIQLCILGAVFGALIFCTMSINHLDLSITISGSTISATTVSGMISGLIITIAVLMTQVHWHYGGIIGYICMTFYTSLILINIIFSHNADSLPGLSFMLAGYLLNTVQVLNLKKATRNVLLNQKSAITDPLTGVYNRRGLTKYIDDLIADNKPFYVLFMDLDNFKKINDSTGHSTGDHILNVMAERWGSLLVKDGIIARNGGDEYVIVLPDSDKSPVNIEDFGQKCVEAAREEIFIEEKRLHVFTTSSIGIARFPTNGVDADDILINADVAMYKSKKSGKDRYTIFTR